MKEKQIECMFEKLEGKVQKSKGREKRRKKGCKDQTKVSLANALLKDGGATEMIQMLP